VEKALEPAFFALGQVLSVAQELVLGDS